MKEFNKFLDKYSELIIFGLIVVFSLFVRFYNFADRINFGPEQARSLVVSGNYLKQGFSFLGQEYFRATSYGHKLFSGAIFNYSLLPLELIFKFNPLPITFYFSLLNIATGLVIYFLTKKIFGKRVAFFTLIFFVFNEYMIYHSLFIWILNYLPLIGFLTLYFLYRYHKDRNLKYSVVLGLLAGLGVNFHYFFTPIFLAILIYIAIKSRFNYKQIFVYLAASVLGNFTMVIFDLRHNFYHLKTVWQYVLDTLNNPGQSSITYYHFLHFWPLICLVLGLIFEKIWNKNRFIALFFIVVYLYLNIFSSKVSFNKAIGMSDNLTWNKINFAANVIAKDKPVSFNVVSLLDFDARGYILRYPMEFIYGYKPLGVEDYPDASVLYVLSTVTYDFSKSATWEITSFKFKKVELLAKIDENYSVYKLTK